MAGVHGLQHVERFFAAALTDNDTVGAHSERITNEVALSHFPLALDIGGARLQSADVRLLQLQFGRIFDRDQAFPGRNEIRQRVEHRRLAGAGAARDQRRNLARNRGCENLRDRRPQASDFNEPVHIENALGEFSNRYQRSIDGDRPDRNVDARAIAQPRIDHGRGFVDAPPDRRDDPIDDAQEVRFILEMDLGLLQLPEALDVAALMRVDENVGDRRVLQQRFERAIARHLGDDLIRENVELFLIERQAFAANVVADISSNLLCKFVRQLLQRRQIEFVDDALVQLQLFVQ